MIFGAAMVRAILKGRKTQTRRLKFTGKVGDLIWVRETWKYHDWSEDGEPWIHYAADDVKIFYAGIGEDSAGAPLDKWEELSAPENYDIDNRAADRKWRASTHMPRWAARIELRVTAVRSERLGDISEDDAQAEGVEADGGRNAGFMPHRQAFCHLWRSIHGGLDMDLVVQVIEFELCTTSA